MIERNNDNVRFTMLGQLFLQLKEKNYFFCFFFADVNGYNERRNKKPVPRAIFFLASFPSMTLSPPRQTSPAKEKKFCSSSNHDMCNAHTRTNTRGRANTVQIVYVVTLSRTRDSKRTFFHLSRSSFFVRASLSRLPFTTKKISSTRTSRVTAVVKNICSYFCVCFVSIDEANGRRWHKKRKMQNEIGAQKKKTEQIWTRPGVDRFLFSICQLLNRQVEMLFKKRKINKRPFPNKQKIKKNSYEKGMFHAHIKEFLHGSVGSLHFKELDN